MKKVFVSMMLAGALLAGNNAFAQTTPDASTGATAKKECVDKDKKACENCKEGQAKKGDKDLKKGRQGQSPKFNPFDGIQLTEEQQQKLQALRQGLGPVELTPQQQAKIPENPNLTPEQKKQLKEEKKAAKLQAKKNYLNGVKETLTPEQYMIFLENVYLYAPQDQGKQKGMKSSQKKGQRGDKAKKDVQPKSKSRK